MKMMVLDPGWTQSPLVLQLNRREMATLNAMVRMLDQLEDWHYPGTAEMVNWVCELACDGSGHLADEDLPAFVLECREVVQAVGGLL